MEKKEQKQLIIGREQDKYTALTSRYISRNKIIGV